MSYEENRRFLVGEDLWKKLSARFPGCPAYPRDQPACATCLEEKKIRDERIAKRKLKLKEVKPVIEGIVAGKETLPADCGRMLVVPNDFVADLARLLK
jgi:hypothetical protein